MTANLKSPYEEIGGEKVVRAVVKKFYEIMHRLPEAKIVRDMHPENLQSSEDKLFMFLSGWLGGPQLFQEKYGHPMLRARHLPFKIGKIERDLWIGCMTMAFDETGVHEPLRSELLKSLLRVADHMRNQPEPS